MARNLKSASLLFALLLVSSFLLLSVSEARPLNDDAQHPHNYINKGVEIFFDGLSIEGIKTGGPSSGGKGHRYTNAQADVVVQNFGPSSGGKGHQYTNAQADIVVKNSGPSSGGKGHQYTNAQTDVVVQNSGPSSGGKGHRYTNAQTDVVVKNSGPAPGVGH